MNQVDHHKEHPAVSTKNFLFTWRLWRNVLLAGSAAFVILILTAMVLGPLIIDFAELKPKIQAVVTEETGAQLDFQGIGLSYWPHPAIKLSQVSMTLPEQAEASVKALYLSPKIFPLLGGDLHLARLKLDQPNLTLNLPDKRSKKTPEVPFTYPELQKKLNAAIESIGQMIAGPKLRIDNAQLTIKEGKHNLLEVEGLNLQGTISLAGPNSLRASLQGKLALINLFRDDRQASVQNLNLLCSVGMTADRITVKVEKLSSAKPHLAFSGDLILASTSPAITLNLSGAGINADATRRTALALAGDTTPVKEIFDYLLGGMVEQITFTSHGETWSEVGDFNNILIKGHLQDGKVSVPQIELDLTEVSGDVTISKGILQGSGVSARLNESTGRNGSLQIGLTQGQDLFKLELMLNADLTDTHSILLRAMTDSAFKNELKKIGNLKGTGSGKLTLGDSLNDIRTKVDISELDLAADYHRVPLPITITRGQVALDRKQLELSQFRGTLGKSTLDEFSCQVTWDKDLFFEIGSGRFDLNMEELYPWLVTLEGIRNQLQKVSQMTGRLQLSDFTIKGAVDRPSGWQFASNGIVKNISVKTNLFTEAIDFTEGMFKVQNKQLTFEKLHAAVLDTTVTATGIVGGFPDQFEQVELSLDGRLGSQAITGLSEPLKVPELYAVRAPLDLQNARIIWQPDSAVSFKGLVTVAQGPILTADVDYLPGQLQIHQLDIKDQYSDARMVLDLNKVSQGFKFTGKLQNKTLQDIFINPQLSRGRLEGDFSITIPQTGDAKAVTSGQMTGENLPFFLLTGDKVHVEQITLRSDGPKVQVDIPKLTWKSLIWEPIRGNISFSRDRADIRIAEAKLCGIDTLGLLSYTGDEFSIDMALDGKDLDVGTSYYCLTEGRVKATGSFDFSSKVTSNGQMADLVKGLRGPLEMTFRDGVIEQSKLVARTLEILNVTEIFKGRLPNLNSTGLAYETMTLQGEFDKGLLMIDKFLMVGETLDLLGAGEIHLEENTIEGQLLAAPLKTIDTVVKFIPGINYLMGGTLITIPIGITGTLDDPQVEILSASAVSSSLYNLAERIIKSPIRLFETLFPGDDND